MKYFIYTILITLVLLLTSTVIYSQYISFQDGTGVELKPRIYPESPAKYTYNVTASDDGGTTGNQFEIKFME